MKKVIDVVFFLIFCLTVLMLHLSNQKIANLEARLDVQQHMSIYYANRVTATMDSGLVSHEIPDSLIVP